MAKARRSNQNRNPNADESGSVQWSKLPYDVLLLILMRLGLIDFIAFGCVCTTWRSIALSNRNTFLASREPMTLRITPHAKRACYLCNIFEGRTFKTILPSFSGRHCLGLTCGYLIMCDRKNWDFWLVNPITRHELRFPVLPFSVRLFPADFRAVLVFSPSKSSSVFVITFRNSRTIFFSSPGDPLWNSLKSEVRIVDLHTFNGKIYVLHEFCIFGEMRISPEPTLMLREIKNGLEVRAKRPELISSSEKLFILDSGSLTFELDLNRMEWLARDDTQMGDDVLFLGDFKCSAVLKPKNWADPWKYSMMSEFLESNTSEGACESWIAAYLHKELGKGARPYLWYFPHDCCNQNVLDER